MRFDLHIHSRYSKDSNLHPKVILNTAKLRGLDGIAVTDHNTIKGGVEASKIAENIEVIVGAEIKTNKGEIIGYFLNEEIKSRSFWEVIDEMRSQGAMISIPHPFDFFRINRLRFNEEMLKAVDAIEVINSRCVFDKFNRKALELAEKYGLRKTAGSDAHSVDEIGASGVVADSINDIIEGRISFFGGRTSAMDLIFTRIKKNK